MEQKTSWCGECDGLSLYGLETMKKKKKKQWKGLVTWNTLIGRYAPLQKYLAPNSTQRLTIHSITKTDLQIAYILLFILVIHTKKT